MGPGDTIAFAALMIGLVAIVGIAARAYRARLAFRERHLELTAQAAAEKAATYAAQTERLEARLRVLERIATDRPGQLADQIDALADPRPN